MVFLFVEKMLDIFSNILPHDIVVKRNEPIMHAILGLFVGVIVGIVCLVFDYSIAFAMVAAVVAAAFKFIFDWLYNRFVGIRYQSDINDIISTMFGGVIAWVLIRLLSFIFF